MTTPGAMNCKSLVELVTEYLDGALPEPERARFEAHLAGCDGCTTYLDQIRTTIRVAGALSEEQIPPPAREALLDVYRRWAEETGRGLGG